LETGEENTLGRDCGFECPITSELLHDPVIADDGHSYERTAIESWFATGNRTSPVTGQRLESLVLRPNHALRSAIQQRFTQLKRDSLKKRKLESVETKKEMKGESKMNEMILDNNDALETKAASTPKRSTAISIAKTASPNSIQHDISMLPTIELPKKALEIYK
jgi:hypothetical protein